MSVSLSLVRRLRVFAHEHDEVPAFHAAYLVATFLVAALFNLSFFLILIAAHMCLDIVKYRDLHRFTLAKTMFAVLRESMVDIALFLLALTSVIYLHHELAVVVLSGLARAELTILRAIGTLVPKINIVEHTIGIVIRFEHYMNDLVIDPRKPLRLVEKWSAFAIVACLVLIISAFVVFRGNEMILLNVLSREFSLQL